jgi:hypothetical protein
VSISTDPFPPVAIRTSVLNAILEQFLPSDGSPGVTSLRTVNATRTIAARAARTWASPTRG